MIALYAEALHTLRDVFIAGFLLVALLDSRKKPDETHMFGHGRAQNVAALVAAILFISFTSLELYREAIPHLIHPVERTYQNLPLVLGVLILSMLVAAAPLVKLFRQEQRGAAAKAQFMELINDELGLLAALLGTLFIIWGKPIADPLAAIFVATIIAFNGIKLFRENASLLLGSSPGEGYMEELEDLVLSVPCVLGVHDMRAEYIEPDTVHAVLHIDLAPGTPIEEADRIAEEVQAKIHIKAEVGYCTIHMDPLSPTDEGGLEQLKESRIDEP